MLRELLCGTTRFNDLRRGVPRMSPTLLSKRLKELEEAGVIAATPTGQPGVMDYKPTEAGEDLRGVIMSLGILGAALDQIVAVAEESRSVAVDVGHAAQHAADAAADSRRTHHQLHLSGDASADRKSWWLVIDAATRSICA